MIYLKVCALRMILAIHRLAMEGGQRVNYMMCNHGGFEGNAQRGKPLVDV